MGQHTLNDGSSGSVVIRSGPPASGGGGNGGGGGGGSGKVGASGNYGGPSAKTIMLRKKALQEHRKKQAKEKADAAALAQEQARDRSRQQLLAGLTTRHRTVRAELDQRFAVRTEQFTQLLEKEIRAAQKPSEGGVSDERWKLYSINKEKNAVDGLISRKTAELNTNNRVARSYDGHDPLTRTLNDYLLRLRQFGDGLNNGHQIWESAYNAAHEARLLSTQINALNERSDALAKDHIRWVETLAAWETQRQYAEQRDARIRFKQQADADTRIDRVRLANTLSLPITSSGFSAGVIPGFGHEWGGGISEKLIAAAVSQAIAQLSALLRPIVFNPVGMIIVGTLIPSELGNGELTPEQRNRMLHAAYVPAHTLGLYDRQELETIAKNGGSVEVESRFKPVAIPQGTAIIVTPDGSDLDAWVPVVNAVLDPLTGFYTAEVPGSPTRHLQFIPDATPQVTPPESPRFAVTEPQVQDIPAGVDWRMQDCIVCVPGQEAIYLSFNVPPMGSGFVTGNGQPASADWFNAATQAQGATIPVQIGDQFRGREFKSFEAFDEALWRTLGEHPLLASPFEEVNKKRIEQGFAPYAPKSTWIGENREFELRYQERPEFWSDPFNLDKISVKAPNSAEGWLGIVPAVVPWPIPPASTWTPLAPPGSEHLGSTTLPITPTDPLVYPGSPAIPILPPNETFPAVDEGEIGANIPGFPGDMELPSPDVLFLDRRDDPGVVTGVGPAVSGIWLGEATRGEGAPIPSHIADQLRGREFANFHRFREAFWRAIAADKTLGAQFSAANMKFMRKGNAPFPRTIDQYGGRVKFELHHQLEISQGGAVYDLENIVVMTPRQHVLVHKGGNLL